VNVDIRGERGKRPGERDLAAGEPSDVIQKEDLEPAQRSLLKIRAG
jgi:hypothetical protein